MRQGRVFKRCANADCKSKVEGRRCGRCGSERSSWYYSVDVAPVGSQRQQKLKGGFATKREALTAMHELQESVAKRSYVAPSKMTIGEYLEDWLPTARARLRPGAYDACELHVRAYIVPRLGGIPLQGLTTYRLKAFYAELTTDGRIRGGGGLAPKTVHNIHRTLSSAIRDAVIDRLIEANPAAGAHRQPDSPEMPTWTADQVRAFLKHVAGDRLAALWRLAATTGLRRGELAGLRWRDADFDRGRIAVVQQRAKGGGTVATGATKTRRSRRLVSLDADTLAVLRTHRKQQLEERLWHGEQYHDGGYVFCRSDGKPLHPDRITQLFRELVEKAGLPRISLHGLRHTHATLLLQAGVHPKVVQERLGHASIAITLDTYSHAIPAMQEDAAARLAEMIQPRAGETLTRPDNESLS